MQLQSIIANQDVAGPGSIVSRNPATGDEIAVVPALDEAGARRAVEAASAAYATWRVSPISERQRLLACWLGLLVDEREELARLMAREGGKPFAEGLLADIASACDALAFLARKLPRLLAFEPVTPHQVLLAHWRAGYRYDPLGVVATITPWNYPVAIPILQIATAVAAGNTVVFKPASATVLTGLAIGETARRAGFPSGVINTVALPGSATDALVDHPSVAKVLFTGSVEVGRRVAQRVATRLAPCQLELGGKDAAVVAADADLERAARGIVWGGFMNAGQNCAGTERVYIERPLYQPLVARIAELASALRVGDPLEVTTDIGPMTTGEQREVVVRQVDEALAGGARALTGGRKPEGPGLFYPPTVLVDVREEMAVMKEETFGPVLAIACVNSIDEGIARANASRYGLGASGWTRSRELGDRFLRELDAGVVMVNEHPLIAFAEPTGSWGGLRDSGIGRSHGRFGLLELVNIKYVATDFRRTRAMWWQFPYGSDFVHFVVAALPTLYRRGAPQLRAALALMKTRRFVKHVPKSNLIRWGHRLL